MASKPVAIGPTSKTVIGDIAPTNESPSLSSLTRDSKIVAKKVNWKRYVVPAGLIGLAVFITYKHR